MGVITIQVVFPKVQLILLNSTMKLKVFLFSFALFLATTLPSYVLAAAIPNIDDSNGRVKQVGFVQQGSNDFKADTLHRIVNAAWENLRNIVMPILSGLAVLFLIWAGIQYITAGGNPEKVKRARQNILNIVLAIILLISIYTLLGLVLGTVRNLADVVNKT